jgi:hypothetical protein
MEEKIEINESTIFDNNEEKKIEKKEENNIEKKENTEKNKNKIFSKNSPTIIKSEAKDLLKKIEIDNTDDTKSSDELLNLCLLKKNRDLLLEIGILSFLLLGIKTKPIMIKDIFTRILQLFVQDGKENCLNLKKLNITSTLFEILGKNNYYFLQISVLSLIYWLAQNKDCKKELIDLGAVNTLKEMLLKCEDDLFKEYLNFTINALSEKIQNKEELLEKILNTKIETLLVSSNKNETKVTINSSPSKLNNYSENLNLSKDFVHVFSSNGKEKKVNQINLVFQSSPKK